MHKFVSILSKVAFALLTTARLSNCSGDRMACKPFVPLQTILLTPSTDFKSCLLLIGFHFYGKNDTVRIKNS